MNIREKLSIAKESLSCLKNSIKRCDLCVHSCGCDRSSGHTGRCRASTDLKVHSVAPHTGEEPPISGSAGSGTIFFSNCSMSCEYCQNYRFSQLGEGSVISEKALTRLMLDLAERGCHNINLVSPTHYMPMILEALIGAWECGLEIPIVYNTGGYDSLKLIKSLDGIIDVYLPDIKYSDDAMAGRYSNAPYYVENNRMIILEMFRQTGPLRVDNNIALKGLLIRLLVLPNAISGTEDTLDFIFNEIGKNAYLSVMSQYYPAYHALKFNELSRPIRQEEYTSVLNKMDELGIHNGWIQPFGQGFDESFAGENFESNI